MNGILLDNWTLQDLYTEKIKTDLEEYNKLLEAIVLWDDIYYPNNTYSTWWKYISMNHEFNKLLKPFPDDEKIFKEESEKFFYSIKAKSDFTEAVGVGSIRYAILSNKNGLDYFPCSKRSAFLSQDEIKKIIPNMISRYDLMETFDKEVIRYYKELNSFLGNDVIKFDVPVVVDFIHENTPSNKDYIDYAMELRREKNVIKYREYLSEIEQAINNAQWNKISEFKCATEELVKNIIDKKPCTYSITVSILALPSFNIDIPCLSYKKYIHLSFLRDLCNFAYNRNKYRK